jgi:hypothetical protein
VLRSKKDWTVLNLLLHDLKSEFIVSLVSRTEADDGASRPAGGPTMLREVKEVGMRVRRFGYGVGVVSLAACGGETASTGDGTGARTGDAMARSSVGTDAGSGDRDGIGGGGSSGSGGGRIPDSGGVGSGSSEVGGKLDSGGSVMDGSQPDAGAPTACSALKACCSSVPDPSSCYESVGSGTLTETQCANELQTYRANGHCETDGG